MRNTKKIKIAILDRDGVLNFANTKNGYIGYQKDFKWVSGAKKAIKYLNDYKFKVIVVTNQSGVARKFFKYNDVVKLHNFMNLSLEKISAKIDKFYFCPHHIDGLDSRYKKKCKCRKPGIGNFQKIKKRWDLDLKKTFMIGDQSSDMLFAKKSKIKGYLFKGGNLFTFIKKLKL